MYISVKKLKMYSAMLIIIVGIAIFLIPAAFAAGSIADFPQYMLDTVNTGVLKTIKENLTSNGGQNKFYTLMVSQSGSGGSKTIAGIMTATYAVSMLMVLIISFTRYFQQLDKGADPKESLYKTLSSVFMIGIIVVNIDAFLGYAVQLGEWFINAALDAVAAGANIGANDYAIVSQATLVDLTGKSAGGALWWMESVLILIIPWILSLLMQVVAQMLAWTILIELGVRKAFAPFAIVDIYGEGMRSPGVRYLKKYIATFLKVAIALVICQFGVELMQISAQNNLANFNSLGDVLKYIFQIVAINFTVLGAIMGTGSYADDIVGA